MVKNQKNNKLIENKKAITIVLCAVFSSISFFLLDRFLFHQFQCAVTCGEFLIEIGFFSYFFLNKSWGGPGVVPQWNPISIRFYSLCFLVSDLSFAARYYFQFYQDETLVFKTNIIPNMLGYFAAFLGLFNHFQKEFHLKSKKESLVFIGVTSQVFVLSFFLFLNNFEGKYGPLKPSFYQLVQLATIFFGALTASLGALFFCIAQTTYLSLLGLGLYVQVMADWMGRYKVYVLNNSLFSNFFGLGEYLFFIGLFIVLSASYLLSQKPVGSIRFFKDQSYFSNERVRVLVVSLGVLLIFFCLNSCNTSGVESLFFFNSAVVMVFYISSLITDHYLKMIDFLLADALQPQEVAALPLPEEFRAICNKITQQFLQRTQMKWIADHTQYLLHELKRPFLMFKTGTELLKLTPNKEEFEDCLAQWRPHLQQATHEVETTLNLMADLAHPVELNLEWICLEVLLEEALKKSLALFPHKKVIVRFNQWVVWDNPEGVKKQEEWNLLIPQTIWVLVDSARLKKALENIIVNALEALVPSESACSPACPEQLWLTTHDYRWGIHAWVRIEIGNTGSFIPESLKDHLFKPYATFGKPNGHGLGLAFARNVIHAHQGYLKVLSSAGLHKVVFEVTLPMDSVVR